MAGCAAGTVAYTQGNTLKGSGSASQVAVTLPATVSNCDAVIVHVGFVSPSASVSQCIDDQSNSYASVQTSNVNFGSGIYNIVALWKPAITNSPKTITCTFSTSVTYASLVADEVAGLGTPTLDQKAINPQSTPGTGSNAVTSGSVTTTAADFVYGFGVSVLGGGFTHGTGFTSEQGVASTFYTEWLNQGGAGATAATFTDGAASDYTVTSVLAITPGNAVAPTNTVAPSISGMTQVGDTLTVSNGTWTGSPTSYADQWLSGGSPISGATGSTYVPVTGDIGAMLTATVTATNATGSTPATSAAVGPVTASVDFH
jgi:hypothetical protein